MFAQAAAFDRAWAEGPNAMMPVWVVIIAALLLLIDLYRRKEVVLLNNLGVESSAAVTVGLLPALLFESILLILPG